ncbi:MAG: hypothetical protein EOO81_01035 [Oxalobacteraceae bacterium]|nr:MAG: hypothetical protein EOO81_01035 [Oxalobacteraceae bacterium]
MHISWKNVYCGTNRLVVVTFDAQTQCMLEVITNNDATYVPYARQRPSGGYWEGAVDIVYIDSKTVHVCDRFHANSADAVLDAAVDAMRLAGVF